jgi:hypothetical protein
MFNWAMTQHGVRMPADRNPAATVKRYKEAAPEITFLSLAQIDEQLEALRVGDWELGFTLLLVTLPAAMTVWPVSPPRIE